MATTPLRLGICLLVASSLGAADASATVFSRDGWGWWIDHGGAGARGRGGTGAAVSGYGASGAVNPAGLAGIDVSYGFVSYVGEIAHVSGGDDEYTQRQDYLPEFGGVIVLPQGVRAGILLKTQTDASFERVEPLGGEAGAGDRHITKGSGGWNRIQASFAGPALDGRLHWGVSLGPTFGTVKEDHHYDLAPGNGSDVRQKIEGRLRPAWSASVGAIAHATPRLRAGAAYGLPGSATLIQEVQVIEGSTSSHSTRGEQETPAHWTVGLWGLAHPRLSISADYGEVLWSQAETRPGAGVPAETPYENATRWGVGVEWQSPLVEGQAARWIWRAGYSESTSYVRSVLGEKITERAASLGARARAAKGRAAIDLSLELGERGDQESLGIDERFARFTIGVGYSSAEREY